MEELVVLLSMHELAMDWKKFGSGNDIALGFPLIPLL